MSIWTLSNSQRERERERERERKREVIKKAIGRLISNELQLQRSESETFESHLIFPRQLVTTSS